MRDPYTDKFSGFRPTYGPGYSVKKSIRKTVETKHSGFPRLKYLYLGDNAFTEFGMGLLVFRYFCHNATGRARLDLYGIIYTK